MYFRQITVTPEMAALFLDNAKENRRIKPIRVETLASDIKNGRWTESPQPICFDEDGKLIDGQHRLTAVIRAGLPVVMTVAYDVPVACVLDKGKERDTGDALFMRGMISRDMSSASALAVARRYISVLSGNHKGISMSDTEMATFLNENEEYITKAISISKTSDRTGSICKRAGIQAAILGALICGIDATILYTFARVVNTGFMDAPGQSAAIILRNYALSNPVRGASDANILCMYAEMAIRDFVNENPRRRKYTKLDHVYVCPKRNPCLEVVA